MSGTPSAYDVLRLAMDVAGTTQADGKWAALRSVSKLLDNPYAMRINADLIHIDAQYEAATKAAYAVIEEAGKQRKKAYDELVKRLAAPTRHPIQEP